jgi:Xaa-Pro aminopeptidase
MPVTESQTPTLRPEELAPMAVAPRLERLRERFDALGVDALLVTNLTNIRYLTGFTGSSAMVLVRSEGAIFVTDGRYRTQSEQQLASAGIDADDVSWSAQRRWSADLFGGTLVPTTEAVEVLRLLKDAGEAERIRAACAIADAAFAECRPMLADRPTERDFALTLDATMLRMGAEDLSFDTIVASGTNGARPHHRPGERVIRSGDLVVVDFGALVDGYHSDMTRTVAVGAPDSEAARMLEVVLAAQAAGVESVRSGVQAATVDAACREVITEAGLGDAFVHGTGHGVGLDIHEEPRVSNRSTATLSAGHVVTVEPGVYLPDVGGVRIEDTVLVTGEGCDRLTLAPKSPELSPSRTTG